MRKEKHVRPHMAELEEWKAEILGKSGGILKFIDVGIQSPDDIRRLVYDKYRLKNWINCDIDDNWSALPDLNRSPVAKTHSRF